MYSSNNLQKKVIAHTKNFYQRNDNSIENFVFFEILDASNVIIDEWKIFMLNSATNFSIYRCDCAKTYSKTWYNICHRRNEKNNFSNDFLYVFDCASNVIVDEYDLIMREFSSLINEWLSKNISKIWNKVNMTIKSLTFLSNWFVRCRKFRAWFKWNKN